MPNIQTELPPTESLPAFGSASPGDFLHLAESVYGPERERIAEQARRGRAQEAQATRERGALAIPLVEDIQTRSALMGAEVERRRPTLPAIEAPPSRELSGFLAPSAGEAPDQTVTRLLNGVALFATGLSGLAKGDATASLAALSGAMKGWAEGDRERADRHFADWKTKTESLLERWKMARTEFEDWFKAGHLDLEQRARNAQLVLTAAGFDVDAAKVEREGWEFQLKEVDRRQEQALKLAAEKEKMLGARADAREREAARQEFRREMETGREQLRRELKEMDISARQERAEEAAQATTQRDRERREDREVATAERVRERRAEPMPGRVYDKTLGRMRKINRQEAIEDIERANRDEPLHFKEMNANEISQFDRLALAPSIISQMERLVKRINAEGIGENLTTGVIQKAVKRLGIGPDITQLKNLSADLLTELTTALSGGRPLVSVLHILRGDSLPNESMTLETALRQLKTSRVTLGNRLRLLTDDDKIWSRLEKLGEGYEPAASSLPAFPPGAIITKPGRRQ